MTSEEYTGKFIALIQPEIAFIYDIKDVSPQVLENLKTPQRGKFSIKSTNSLITHYNFLLKKLKADAQVQSEFDFLSIISEDPSSVVSRVARICLLLELMRRHSTEIGLRQ